MNLGFLETLDEDISSFVQASKSISPTLYLFFSQSKPPLLPSHPTILIAISIFTNGSDLTSQPYLPQAKDRLLSRAKLAAYPLTNNLAPQAQYTGFNHSRLENNNSLTAVKT
ncbi:hypothetical protein NC651_003342 [Populus alba x Populus x berolinensis]|nr:hypothetical protein NC651_003342 [Populus alba x Populus x berolinensis]